MDIQFCGGAQTVTGSQHLITVNGKNILLECGLYQGKRNESYEINKNFPFPAASVDVLILSHAHIDHSGNIPNLVKHGFKGKIFATPATVELCKILLRDSAYIQSKDIEWVNKIRKKNNQTPIEPLYTIEEAEATMGMFEPVNYDESFHVAPDVDVTFREAGHILGAASVLLEIKENNRSFRLGFSGDIGRADMPIIRDPNILRDLDALIIETTYGNRTHTPFQDSDEELAEIINQATKSGGKIIIPAFAVGRTQRLVYMLHKLFDEGRIPEIPIYVDSPLACEATEVFRHHPDILDRETNRIFVKNNEDPFGFRRLKYVKDIEDSKKLMNLTYPHIIISASGMAEGGRILHHLANNIEKPNTLLLFVGYSAKDTLARKIMDGQKKVKILGEEYTVKCKMKTMDSFSAHGDRHDILKYVRMTPPERLKNIFLVHGEAEQAESLIDPIKSGGYENVYFPKLGDKFTI